MAFMMIAKSHFQYVEMFTNSSGLYRQNSQNEFFGQKSPQFYRIKASGDSKEPSFSAACFLQ